MRKPPGGESMAEVITRVGAAMERLADEHAGREVVIVSHGGAIRGAIAHALRIGPDNALHMSIQNLSLSRLQHSPDGWRVVCVNELPATEAPLRKPLRSLPAKFQRVGGEFVANRGLGQEGHRLRRGAGCCGG